MALPRWLYSLLGDGGTNSGIKSYAHENGVYIKPQDNKGKLIWDTTTDWSRADVSHNITESNGVLSHSNPDTGLYTENFDGGEPLYFNEIFDQGIPDIGITTTRPYSGSHSLEYRSRNYTGITLLNYSFELPRKITQDISFMYYETSNNTSGGLWVTDHVDTDTSNPDVNNKLLPHWLAIGTNNPQIRADTDSQENQLIGSPGNTDYGVWRRLTLTNWNWDNQTVDVVFEDVGDTGNVQTFTISHNLESVYRINVGKPELGDGFGGGNGEMWLDEITGPWNMRAAKLITSTKSLAESQSVSGTDIRFSLNGGQAAYKVIGGDGQEYIDRFTGSIDNYTGDTSVLGKEQDKFPFFERESLLLNTNKDHPTGTSYYAYNPDIDTSSGTRYRILVWNGDASGDGDTGSPTLTRVYFGAGTDGTRINKGYYVELDANDDEGTSHIELGRRLPTGEDEVLDTSGNTSLQENRWHEIYLNWEEDGTLEAEVQNVYDGRPLFDEFSYGYTTQTRASCSATDTNITSGNIAYEVYEGYAYFDALQEFPYGSNAKDFYRADDDYYGREFHQQFDWLDAPRDLPLEYYDRNNTDFKLEILLDENATFDLMELTGTNFLPPAVTTDTPSHTDTTATLNGTLTRTGGNYPTYVWFEWREVGASSWNSDWDGNDTTALREPGSWSKNLSGINGNTEYEYRAKTRDGDDQTDDGGIIQFKTDPAPLGVTTDSTSNITHTGATLNGTLTGMNAAESCDVGFDYRETGASTWNQSLTQTVTDAGSFSIDISGLTDLTDYEFRATVTSSKDESATGSTKTFQTTTDEVYLTTVHAQEEDTTATFTGTLDHLGQASSADCYFEYGPVGNVSANQTSATTLSSTGEFVGTATGLTADTTYEYRAVADSSDGDSGVGGTSQFTTFTVAPVVLEGFEHNDLSKYKGSTNYFSIGTESAQDGSYALTSSEYEGSVIRTDIAVAQGETLDVWIHDEFSIALFGMQDTSNATFTDIKGYGVWYNDYGDLEILRFDAERNYNTIASLYTDTNPSGMHRVRIDWAEDGTITATAYDTDGSYIDETSTVDTTYTSGGIGAALQGSANSTYWDTYRRLVSRESPLIKTVSAESTAYEAILTGSLDHLGNSSTVDVYFEWGPAGSVSENTTEVQAQSNPGDFTQEIYPSNKGESYDYRVAVDDGSGVTYGQTKTFNWGLTADMHLTADSITEDNTLVDSIGSHDGQLDTTSVSASDYASVTGQFGNAIQFNNDSGHNVEVPGWESLWLSETNPISLSFWFYVADDGSGSDDFQLLDVNQHIQVRYSRNGSNDLNWATYGNNTDTGSGPYARDTWHHCAVTWDHQDGVLDMWVDNAHVVDGVAYSDDIESYTNNLFLGMADADNRHLPNGSMMDEIYIIPNYSLTDANVDSLYNNNETPILGEELTVDTQSASGIGMADASLNGYLVGMGNNSSVDVFFEYREAGASTWTSTTTQTLSATGRYSENLSGLTNGADYEFRAVAVGIDNTVTGRTITFTTEYDTTVETGEVNLGDDMTTASLSGQLTAVGDVSTADVSFQWGPTGSVTTNQTTPETMTTTGSYTHSISGLTEGSDYDYRAYASASDGDTAIGETVTFTAGDTVIDNFEDGNITEYNGDTGNFQTVQSPVYEGSYALEGHSGGSWYNIASTSIPQFQQGDTVEFWWYCPNPGSSRGGFCFGIQDETAGANSMNGYAVCFAGANNEQWILRFDNGSNTKLARPSQSWSADTWYRGEVSWETDGTITFTTYDADGNHILQASATDTTFSSGATGFITTAKGSVNNYYDIAKIL